MPPTRRGPVRSIEHAPQPDSAALRLIARPQEMGGRKPSRSRLRPSGIGGKTRGNDTSKRNKGRGRLPVTTQRTCQAGIWSADGPGSALARVRTPVPITPLAA